ncbi:hypothetical protein HLI01_08880 [Rhizobium laguerreae]|uniref:hypothetical protein n=1 Tax=Rhizobium laguerreae TaxID=1076926 RepID=UPI00147887C4|nr:hypothetical protein [Rhizobium laguerreae]NNH56921.1 hypothetical protein [Rhizobium laguerreae]
MPSGISSETGVSHRFKDRTGTRNGRLVFTKYLGLDDHRHGIWEAVCDCGFVTTTSQPHSKRSCGCLQRETAARTQANKALPQEERTKRILANRVRQRQRRKSDPRLAMQARLSRLHRHALAQVGAIKTSSTFEQLGYTAAEFVRHIERQFFGGMGWRNMSEWQVDHIIPVSSAKSEEDVIALNQLSNLRPMWAVDNNAKKNKRLSLL